MNNKPIHSERHMRIACIGAGASGLCFAYKLQRSFQNFSLSIYEKGADVGGVWLQNRYPGYVNKGNHSISVQIGRAV
jgi:cation diffusion facilitator CzcD-associated flavoprotein CzcO